MIQLVVIMGRKFTRKQLINAELATRSFNTKAKNILKRHTPKKSQPGLVIAFQCECSNEQCQERVPLTLEQYEEIHKHKAYFVLAKGHEEPKVEKVKLKSGSFSVVEKEALS